MTGYFEQETLHLFALQLRLPCQIGIILKKRRISCQKLSPSNFLADDLTFTFYFVSGKVSCKVQRIGKLIPGKMTKINEE